MPVLLVLVLPVSGRADPAVETITPTVAPALRAVEQTGTVAAVRGVDLVARVSGTLEQIDYRDGQAVKKGDLLFVIEPAPYRAALAGAEAGVAQARAALTQAQSTLERDEKLVGGAISAVQLDTARNERDEARAQLASAEAERDQARINLGYTEIRAPFDGFVTAHQADVGALVGQGGVTTLASIVQMDPVEVDFAVSDQDMLRMRTEAKARGRRLDDLEEVVVQAGTQTDDGYPVEGHLDYIAPETNPTTGTLSVRAVFANPDRDLIPGLFVRLRIPLRTDPGALFLPDAAIGADQGGNYVLTVDEQGEVKRVAVTLGLRSDAGQEVQGALSAGSHVVANVLSGVRAGDRVEVTAAHPFGDPSGDQDGAHAGAHDGDQAAGGN